MDYFNKPTLHFSPGNPSSKALQEKGIAGLNFFQSEDGYHQMIDQIEDYAIIFLNREGRIENWNKGAERIKGYTAEEVIGKNFSMFYTEEDKASQLPQKLITKAAESGKATHEGWRVRKDGSRFWGSILITAIHDSSNAVIGFTKVTRDLTERKNAEDNDRKYTRELERKNEELESINNELKAFAYVSSHDLQEPLRKIQTFSDKILEKEFDLLSPQGQDYFTRMKNAAKRMQSLIEDLLSYAQTNVAERILETIDLSALMQDVRTDLKELIDSKDAEIVFNGLGKLEAIPFQFKQLMQNLISNALKFSKAGVKPVVKINREAGPGSSFDLDGLDPQTNYTHLSVEDNGIGFEKEYSNKIFELFQRLHGKHEYPGTGIGLSICKKIVENHKGLIFAESTFGEGSTFHIYLPGTN